MSAGNILAGALTSGEAAGGGIAYSAGTLAARGPGATAGNFYYATDTGEIAEWDGVAWQTLRPGVPAVAASCIHRWKCNEASGNLADSVGSATATLTGTDVRYRQRRALRDYDGIEGFTAGVGARFQATVSLATPYTLECVARRTSLTAIAGNESLVTINTGNVSIRATVLGIRAGSSLGNTTLILPAAGVFDWAEAHTYALKINAAGTSMAFLIDGVQAGAAANPGAPGTGTIAGILDIAGGGESAPWQIIDVRIYNTEMSDADLLTNAKSYSSCYAG